MSLILSLGTYHHPPQASRPWVCASTSLAPESGRKKLPWPHPLGPSPVGRAMTRLQGKQLSVAVCWGWGPPGGSDIPWGLRVRG